MGCVSSKNVVAVTPLVDSSGILRDQWEISEEIFVPSARYQDLKELLELENEEKDEKDEKVEVKEEEEEVVEKENAKDVSFRLGNLHRYVEGEQVAAGWPKWLTVVAGEAVQGWVPLRADSFEKLEKIGQGTYSNVFRARHLDTGKIFALKKVRFDNLEPESVRFMAREIQILRRLDHPNVIKLEGLITSPLSCSLYLVFEYMEHDLAGLSSSPDIKFSESQRKCYLKQLLSGMEHCHSHGVIHRDIKGANLLVNNQGILKIADFGLANFYNPEKKQPLTSRVVTLWYRPPELLLGSTDYGPTVDVWSIGCVFAEMFTGKPILQGRTEVEQLHKIFKLCGSPPEEYWKKSKLPHATIFKPHRPYESCLQATFDNLPESAIDLLKSLLTVEPYKRSTASSALASEYFRAEPYACEPSSLPRYPPNKEIDAKYREDLQRRKVAAKGHGIESTRTSRVPRGARQPNDFKRSAEKQEASLKNFNGAKRNNKKQDLPNMKAESRMFVDLQPLPTLRPPVARHTRHNSQENIPFSGPMAFSSGAAPYTKRQAEQRVNAKSHRRSLSKTNLTSILDSSSIVPAKINSYIKGQENGPPRPDNRSRKPQELGQHSVTRKSRQMQRPDSFDAADVFRSQDFSEASSKGGDLLSTRHNPMGFQDQKDRIEFSGPLLSQTHKVDELLQKNERHIRQVIRKSWLQRVTSRRQEN